jgi:hypothetical protein
MTLKITKQEVVKSDIEKNMLYYCLFVGGGRAIPLEAWKGHEGSGNLKLPDFKTIGI